MSQFQVMALIMGLVFGSIGYSVGGKRGRPGLGAALGFFLGLIGLLILLVVPKKRTYGHRSAYVPGAYAPPPGQALCPGCRAPVDFGASVCQRCGTPTYPQGQPPAVAPGYSAIEPEAWWYQEQGQPLPQIPAQPTSSSPPPPPPPPPPGP